MFLTSSPVAVINNIKISTSCIKCYKLKDKSLYNSFVNCNCCFEGRGHHAGPQFPVHDQIWCLICFQLCCHSLLYICRLRLIIPLFMPIHRCLLCFMLWVMCERILARCIFLRNDKWRSNQKKKCSDQLQSYLTSTKSPSELEITGKFKKRTH